MTRTRPGRREREAMKRSWFEIEQARERNHGRDRGTTPSTPTQRRELDRAADRDKRKRGGRD